MVGDDIYVIGGFHGDNHYHKNCRKYNLYSKTWSHVTPMNVERCYVSTAVVDDKIYAVGGYNGRFRLNTAEVLNLKTNQVSELGQLTSVLFYFHLFIHYTIRQKRNRCRATELLIANSG